MEQNYKKIYQENDQDLDLSDRDKLDRVEVTRVDCYVNIIMDKLIEFGNMDKGH